MGIRELHVRFEDAIAANDGSLITLLLDLDFMEVQARSRTAGAVLYTERLQDLRDALNNLDKSFDINSDVNDYFVVVELRADDDDDLLNQVTEVIHDGKNSRALRLRYAMQTRMGSLQRELKRAKPALRDHEDIENLLKQARKAFVPRS